MSPTHFHPLGTIKENSLHFNLEEHYVVRLTSSSKHLTSSSSQINDKQKREGMHHTFIYIVSQVPPKIFFRFTIRGGAPTKRPKAQPFSLSLCTHFNSNYDYFASTFEDRKNVRDWMDLRSQYQRRKTKPRYSIENLRRKKLLTKVMKNYKPFVGYL
jgi:hypothetical protein